MAFLGGVGETRYVVRVLTLLDHRPSSTIIDQQRARRTEQGNGDREEASRVE